jgi:hypothetical protein
MIKNIFRETKKNIEENIYEVWEDKVKSFECDGDCS